MQHTYNIRLSCLMILLLLATGVNKVYGQLHAANYYETYIYAPDGYSNSAVIDYTDYCSGCGGNYQLKAVVIDIGSNTCALIVNDGINSLYTTTFTGHTPDVYIGYISNVTTPAQYGVTVVYAVNSTACGSDYEIMMKVFTFDHIV